MAISLLDQQVTKIEDNDITREKESALLSHCGHGKIRNHRESRLLMGQISLFQAAFPSIPSLLKPSTQHRHGLIPALLLALSVCAVHGQAPSAGQSLAPAGHAIESAPQPDGSSAGTVNDSAWLASIGRLYYSTAKAGLTGFDCTVHPDWRNSERR
jgi:hypothetical protein